MERKFELVSTYSHLGEDFIPKRSTKDSAGYDFRCAEDTIIPSYFRLMYEFGVSEEASLICEQNLSHTEKCPTDVIEAGHVSEELLKHFGLQPTLVPTGVKAKMPKGEFLSLEPRSSLPMKTLLIMSNSEGIIDGDYYNNKANEGHIYVQLINLSPFDIRINKGERIAQGIFLPYGVVPDDNTTTERIGGIGSTGRN